MKGFKVFGNYKSFALLCFFSLFSVLVDAAVASPTVEELLEEGRLEEAEVWLELQLNQNPKDELARFQLGTVQLLRAVEGLTQEVCRLGVTRMVRSMPVFRLGLLDRDAEPEKVTYQKLRGLLADFQSSVAEAEGTLASLLGNDFYWAVDFEKVAINFNGDAEISERECLKTLFDLVNRPRPRWPVPEEKEEPKTIVGFDAADGYWLQGYCHALQAMCDMVLAYDQQRLFDKTAHAFFADPDTSYAEMRNLSSEEIAKQTRSFFNEEQIFDGVAVIHLIDFKLVDEMRMESCHQHLLKMVELSRLNWKAILKETDDRNEWIPAPGQTSVIRGLELTQEQLDAWHKTLAETESILKGDKLIPFWRSGFDESLNLKRAFLEPRDFDLILWVQGNAALPYLEEGGETSVETWNDIQRVFRGQFFSFALWVN